MLYVFEQAKPETVDKVCKIVRKQLALPDDSAVSGESKFSALGADSLDTVRLILIFFSLNYLSSYEPGTFFLLSLIFQ